MRIGHVVTLISPDGAYGGPVRVAINQAKALIALGHQVTVFAATRGFVTLPAEIDNVPVRLFRVTATIPGTGFAGMMSIGMMAAIIQERSTIDLWHVHLARDLITLPIATYLRSTGRPYVAQCHGMIDETNKRLAQPMDRYLAVPALRSASSVLTLTPREEKSLRNVAGPRLSILRIPNGVPALGMRPKEARNELEVLFLARLQLRKRPLHFVESALALSNESPHVHFSLVGPDEGQGRRVSERIAEAGMERTIHWEGPLPPNATLSRMARASIYVLPAVDEPFPMSVLEAMSLGVPVIVTDSCGLAPYIASANAGIVVDDEQESLTTAIRSLLKDDARRVALGANARKLIVDEFSITSVAQLLSAKYSEVIHQYQPKSVDIS